MITFITWLERREGFGSKVLALGIPMAAAVAGGAAGLAAAGPLAALPSWIAAKRGGEEIVKWALPTSTAELMKKMKKK